MNMNKNGAIEKIHEAYEKLEGACAGVREWDRYVHLVRQSALDYRLKDRQYGLRLRQTVELFAVKNVFERFVSACGKKGIYTPQAKDFFWNGTEVFAACAIAKICRGKILNAFVKEEMRDWLDTIDFVALNVVERKES